MFRQGVIVFIFIGLSVLLSCKKDKVPCTGCPPTGTSNCEDIQNVKKFFAFKVGSWWLYEEENSGARDSVYVTQYANDPSNYNFDVRVYSTYQDYFYHYWPIFASGGQNCNESGSICKYCISIKFSKYKIGNFVDEIRCFHFTPQIGQGTYESHSGYPDNRVETEDILNSFSTGNLSFSRTVIMFENNALMENNQPTRRYYSEGAGLTRKELLDSNQVWNLIDYYIQE